MELRLDIRKWKKKNGGEGGGGEPNNYDGWGVLNLSELVDFDELYSLDSQSERPVSNVWIHDSFRLADNVPSSHLSNRIGEGGPIEYLMNNTWDGSGAVGPFLSTGDVFQQRFILQDFTHTLSYVFSLLPLLPLPRLAVSSACPSSSSP